MLKPVVVDKTVTLVAQVIEGPEKVSANVISGKLMDISQRGLAFLIKTSHNDPARFLNGKNANIVMEIEKINPASELFWEGAIVGVKALKAFRYSIHLHGKNNSDAVTSLLEQFY